MPAECRTCSVHSNGLLSVLSHNQFSRLAQERVAHTYRPGQIVFYEGNPALAVYCIRSGRVKLFKEGRHDEEIVVGVRTAGDFIGVRAVLAKMPYGMTAETLDPSVVCAIPRETFLDLLNESRAFALELLKQLARQDRNTEVELIARTQARVAQRTARFLLEMTGSRDPQGRRGAASPFVSKREEMAQRIGTTPETLSRTLHALALQGVIELCQTGIRVRSRSALEKLAH